MLPAGAVRDSNRGTVHRANLGHGDVPLMEWDSVYHGTAPLLGWEAIAESLPASLSLPLQLHHFVALTARRPVSAPSSPADEAAARDDHTVCTAAWHLDFLPLDPTSPAVAAALAAGRSVPGQIRSRRMKALISGRAISTTRWVHTHTPPRGRCAISKHEYV